MAALKHMIRKDREEELEKHSAYCKGFRASVNEYFIYVYGYLEPKLRELKDAGKLTNGKYSYLFYNSITKILFPSYQVRRNSKFTVKSGGTGEIWTRKAMLVEWAMLVMVPLIITLVSSTMTHLKESVR